MADTSIPHQACRKCGRNLPLTSFSKNGSGGIRRQCQTCNADACFARTLCGKSEEEVAHAIEQRQQMLAIRAFEQANPEMKWCQKGAHFQPRSAFSANAKLPSGLQSYCRECKRGHWLDNRERYRTKAKEWREATVEQRKQYGADYYARNREQFLAKCKEYRELHKEEVLERQGRYREQHREELCAQSIARYHAKSAEILAKQKKRRDENLEQFHAIEKERYRARPEAMRANRKAYYRKHKDEHYRRTQLYKHANKDKVKKWSEKWEANNRDKRRAALQNNRARRNKAAGRFTKELLLQKYAFHGWRCYLCGTPITLATSHPEHRKPIARGGTNWIANIAPACAKCNLSKGAKTESEFREFMAA